VTNWRSWVFRVHYGLDRTLVFSFEPDLNAFSQCHFDKKIYVDTSLPGLPGPDVHGTNNSGFKNFINLMDFPFTMTWALI
jgi:hypothetical protein